MDKQPRNCRRCGKRFMWDRSMYVLCDDCVSDGDGDSQRIGAESRGRASDKLTRRLDEAEEKGPQ